MKREYAFGQREERTMKEKKTIALIFGGRGCEREVSRAGADFVFPLLKTDSCSPLPIFIEKSGKWLAAPDLRSENLPKDPGSSPEFREFYPICQSGRGGISSQSGEFIEIDVAIPLLHGDFGEDGVVQGALDCAGIRYIGCDIHTGSLLMDKINTKIIAEFLGIEVAKFSFGIKGSPVFSPENAKKRAEELFGYPMFIKPARLGSSFGASAVYSESDFEESYKKAEAAGEGRVLIEELVDIDFEAECAYFKVKNKEIISNLAGISCTFGFYDHEKKYITPHGTSIHNDIKELGYGSDIYSLHEQRAKEQVKLLAEFFGVRHLSRFDFFITKSGKLIFNEINTFPGFTETSLYPKLIERCGLPIGEALKLMISDALG